MRLVKLLPKYCKDKASGQAVVKVLGCISISVLVTPKQANLNTTEWFKYGLLLVVLPIPFNYMLKWRRVLLECDNFLFIEIDPFNSIHFYLIAHYLRRGSEKHLRNLIN
jgi:hypothetical protein